MNSRLPAGGRLDDAHHWFGLPNVGAASEEQTGGIRDDKRLVSDALGAARPVKLLMKGFKKVKI